MPDSLDPAPDPVEQVRSILLGLPAPALDAEGRLADAVPCRRCRYELRGLDPFGACPECGCPVSRSLYGDLVRFTIPARLAAVVQGWRWLVIVIPAAYIIGFLLLAGVALLVDTQEGVPDWLLVPALLIHLAWLAAVWRATGPLNLGTARIAPIIARLATVGWLAHAMVVWWIPDGASPEHHAIARLLHGIMSTVALAALMSHARTLSRQLPDATLQVQWAAVMWGLLVPWAIANVGRALGVFFGSGWTAEGTAVGSASEMAGFIASIVITLLLHIFAVWGFVLLVRLSRQLQEALDQSRRLAAGALHDGSDPDLHG